MSNLSCHAAQRLVSLLHLLDRRHSRLKAEAVAAAAAGSGMESEETTERRTLELQLYSDFLRIVLEIVNAILTNALPSNPELVYTLLHRQEVFASFRADSKYSELMENVTLVVDYFGKKVEEAGRDGAIATADRVLEVIKLHSRGWRRDRLRAFPELRFTYEEGEHAWLYLIHAFIAVSTCAV